MHSEEFAILRNSQIFFNLLEDQLVTTSIDKSVRFWSVETGEMLKVFTDSSPVPVAAFLPFNPQVFVAANSNAVLRLVNVQNGMVLQKLKVETEVRALKFDDSGLFLLAGILRSLGGPGFVLLALLEGRSSILFLYCHVADMYSGSVSSSSHSAIGCRTV